MDDQALAPNAPILEPQEVEEQGVSEALAEEKEIARAYFHKDWVGVQKMFEEEIEALSQHPDPNLIADEYKIEGIANQKAKNRIVNLLARIQDAVESTERGTK